jgi:hypothetical protein
MTDRTRKLHDALAELHRQLARAESLDPALRRELLAAMDEVNAQLDAGREAEAPLAERVSDLMLRFEAAHPALSEAVGAVASALSRLGI